MSSFARTKINIRGWLSGRPWLLEAVFRLLGKPYTEIVMFRALVRAGDTVFDIGANTGQYSCLFCSLAGPRGAVHSFEPIPPTFAILKMNATRHASGCPVHLNNVAVSDREGSIKMYVANDRFTEASMVRHGEGPDGRSAPAAEYAVRATTIDRYMDENKIGDVALVKCDVEGAELFAMKGAINLLKGKHPPILFLEAWEKWTTDFGYRPADLFSFLEREAGYEIYHVYRGGIRRIGAQDALPEDSFPDFLNFLCIVPAAHRDRLASLERAGVRIS